MFLNKLHAILFAFGLGFQMTVCTVQATAQNIKNAANPAELKQYALQLLASVSRETGQFKLVENRVRARTIIADLMWEHDKPAARVIYQYAFTDLRNLLGEADAARIEEKYSATNAEHFANRFRLNKLRREYVLTLAARDPAAAIEALRSLKTKKIEGWEPLTERFSILKLETATAIAAKDPNRSYAIYSEEIAADGITLPVLESLNELHRKNPELTAKIAKDIFAIVKTARIGERAGGENSAKIAFASSKPTELEFWQVTAFLNAASKLKRRTELDKKTRPPLTGSELKELAELLARAFLAKPKPEKNTINKAMTAITRHAPHEVRSIRLKVGAEGVRSYETVMKSDAYYCSLEEKGADELALEADGATGPDHRDLLYSEAARKALAETQAEKAKTIASRIKNREAYVGLLEEIETAVPIAVARRGSEAEVRKLLTGLKPGEKRIGVLTEFAFVLAARGERAAAKKALDEAVQNLFTASPANESERQSSSGSHLVIAGKFASVYAVVAPDEAFTNIEPVIEAVNAEIKRNNSAGDGSVKTKEFFYDAMELELFRQVGQTIDLLKNLARADFERTVSLVNKFERPEIRLVARLRLAQSILDPQSAEKEKLMFEQFLAEMGES